MIDQVPLPQGADANGEAGICCKTCSPIQRKIGYYITFALGFFLFLLGIINSFGFLFGESTSALYLAAGGLIIILNPLWIKPCSKIIEDMKQPQRLTSSIIFIVCLIVLLLSKLVFDVTFLSLIFSVLTVLSGLWYFLSYFENGQAAFITCIKTCCGSKKNDTASSSGDTANSSTAQ